jgi:hypothetical protein
LSEEGKKIIQAVGKANLLLAASGLDPAQSKSLLETTNRPLFLVARTQPNPDIVELVKKTKSALGLVLEKDEDPEAYFRELDDVKKAVGAENLSIVAENCLWGEAGKEQVVGLIGEMLEAKYESEDLARLFSGAFLGVLERARAADAAQASPFRPF